MATATKTKSERSEARRQARADRVAGEAIRTGWLYHVVALGYGPMTMTTDDWWDDSMRRYFCDPKEAERAAREYTDAAESWAPDATPGEYGVEEALLDPDDLAEAFEGTAFAQWLSAED